MPACSAASQLASCRQLSFWLLFVHARHPPHSRAMGPIHPPTHMLALAACPADRWTWRMWPLSTRCCSLRRTSVRSACNLHLVFGLAGGRAELLARRWTRDHLVRERATALQCISPLRPPALIWKPAGNVSQPSLQPAIEQYRSILADKQVSTCRAPCTDWQCRAPVQGQAVAGAHSRAHTCRAEGPRLCFACCSLPTPCPLSVCLLRCFAG